MPHRSILTCLLIALLFITQGCAQLAGRPMRSMDLDTLITTIEKSSSAPEIVDAYYKDTTTDQERLSLRNKLIDRTIILIDLHYSKFVEQFSSGKKALDASAEISSVATAAAATLLSPATTKSILAAISGGITASKSSFDKNFMYEQTVLVLIKQMEAQRRAALVPLLEGSHRSLAQYSLTSALADLEQYYFAGTFDGALAGVQQQAADVRHQADTDIENLQQRLDSQLQRAVDRSQAWANSFEDAARFQSARTEIWSVLSRLIEEDARAGVRILSQAGNVIDQQAQRLESTAPNISSHLRSTYLDENVEFTQDLLMQYVTQDADPQALSALVGNIEASLNVELPIPE